MRNEPTSKADALCVETCHGTYPGCYSVYLDYRQVLHLSWEKSLSPSTHKKNIQPFKEGFFAEENWLFCKKDHFWPRRSLSLNLNSCTLFWGGKNHQKSRVLCSPFHLPRGCTATQDAQKEPRLLGHNWATNFHLGDEDNVWVLCNSPFPGVMESGRYAPRVPNFIITDVVASPPPSPH